MAKHANINLACTQGGGNLGVKMKRQVIQAQRQRSLKSKMARDLIIIGADVPNLCELDIASALTSLRGNELVIGPSKDGGYWLIGFSRKLINPSIYWPFSGIRWGTSSVFSETNNRAKVKGIKYKLISIKNDIDVIEDLKSWYS